MTKHLGAICRIFAMNLIAALLGVSHASAQAPTRFGVIEIGGSGVKPSIVSLDLAREEGEDNAPDLVVLRELSARNVNPVFVEQIDAVAETVQTAVTAFRAAGIPATRIYVVASSGIATLGHAELLRTKVDRAVAGAGGALVFISADDEARLGFNGVVNCVRLGHRRLQSVFIDIGSANVAAAYVKEPGPYCGGESIRAIGLPWGVKLLERRAHAMTSVSLPAAAEAVRKTVVTPDLDAAVGASAPGLETLPRVYLGGGIVWALSTFTHPDDPRRYVPLTADDIARVRAQLIDKPECITDMAMAQRADAACRHLDVNLSRIQDPARRAGAIAQHREIVTTVLSKEQLLVGAEIAFGFSERLDFAHRTVLFARPAKRAWMLGYLLAREGRSEDAAEIVPPK